MTDTTRTRKCFALGVSLSLLAGCVEPPDVAPAAPPPDVATTSRSLVSSGASHTFATGSLIIPMDTTYQDNGMFLAYGLVYQLLLNGVPVSWVIKPSKRLSTLAASPGGATEVGTTATFTTTQPHALGVGDIVLIAGVGVAGYNGSRTVTAIVSATQFTATLAASGLAASGGGTVTPSDFTASATDKQSGAAITSYAYRGGPFVIDQLDAATANPLVTAWQTANPTTKVHVATAPFDGYVKRELIAAPTIAMFADGNEDIAAAYLNAAKIPDSLGNPWPPTSPDLLTPAQVAGTTCAGTSDCISTPHNDGALFDASNVPKYCQMMSMHWNRGCATVGCTAANPNAQSVLGREVVREYRAFLQFPTHLFTECQAANAVENNTNPSKTIAASPMGATQVGTTATFTTTAAHSYAVGDAIAVAGVAVAGYNGTWTVASIVSATAFTAVLPTAGLAASGGGSVASYNGLFLTTTGYTIDARPTNVDSYDFDQPFAQYDGPFNTTGGSEPSYSIPVGGAYKAMDVVMLTERGTPPGTRDVWMTGFLDGTCSITSEYCDPSFSQGKVSVLGGHNYGTTLPISNGNSQGTRMFLNALFEAPCATDVGAATLELYKTGQTSTNLSQATFTITAFNPGDGVAGNVILTDVLPNNVKFVAATAGGLCAPAAACASGTGSKTVTWNVGNLAGGQSTAVDVTVEYTAAAIYTNTAGATFQAGLTAFTVPSNTTQTCYYAGDPAICGGGCDASAPACANGCDDDGDGLIDFPDDPGCAAATNGTELDEPQDCSVIKGRVLIVFDTSGSMNWNTCDNSYTGGDGSLACPGGDVSCATCASSTCGNAVADDGRLQKVKTGITDAVAGFGEVEWSLMRFTQIPVPFACGTQNVNRGAGGWQGAGGSPCGGFASGDILVKFDPDAPYDLLTWMDGASNYPGVPPPGKDFELRASGNTPLAGALASARSYVEAARSADCPGVSTCRPYRVLLVTDGGETCAGDPVAQAATLFAAGDPNGLVPVHVVGFSTPDPTVQMQLDQIAIAGGTGGFVAADDDIQVSAAIQEIVQATILSELCNGLDDDCDSLVDEDFPDLGTSCTNGLLGACLRTGTRVCRADGLGTQCTALPATGSSEVCNGVDDDCDGLIDDGVVCPCTPTGSTEICNGADDNCNGVIDELPIAGVGDVCGLSIGACTPGTLECVGGTMTCVGGTGPTAEICNNVDDDCDTIVDGMIDECYTGMTGCTIGVGCTGVCNTGYWTCTMGVYGPCNGEVTPTAELCNGLDDDCDGLVDEDFPLLGATCDNGLLGTCMTSGTYQCLADGSGVFCTAPPVGGGLEVCNGIDDDCDGLIDEPTLPAPIGNPCGGGGTCIPGVLECVGGVIVCVGGSSGTPEICNGIDDDCDGLIDEPVLSDTGGPCTDPGFDMIGDTGTCEFGQIVCVAGMLECDGYLGPGVEICNGLDDDCDGLADDMAECPVPDDLCYQGACVAPCGLGEFPCPFGFTCATLPEGDFCVPSLCTGVDCPAGFDCDEATGACVDRCLAVVCQAGETCQDGFCLDCFQLGCVDESERCVMNGMGVGECEPDPCFMNTCDALTQFCRPSDGVCVDVCTTCPAGQVCIDNTCVDDSCTDVMCPTGQICRPSDGTCVTDLCSGVTCGLGLVCNPATGGCIADPCLDLTCPMGLFCTVGTDGMGACAEPPPRPGYDVFASGGGGCNCDAGHRGGPGSGALLLLGFVALLRRWRAGASRAQPTKGGPA